MKKVLLLVLGVTLSLGIKANASVLERFGGLDRYETAAQINNTIESKTLILVSGNNYADALVAAPLVYHLDGEIHIANDELSENTIKSIENKEFDRAVIVGGYGVISKDIEEQLKKELTSVVRYAGETRYETSDKVAKAIMELTEQEGYKKYPNAFLVSGSNFADALSVSSVAAITGSPILLTNGEVSEITINALSTATNSIYKIGGVATVGNDMDKLIGTDYKRLGGVDRYETNKIVIEQFKGWFNKEIAYVASGLDYPDALTGSAIAGKAKEAIILSNPEVSKYSKEAMQMINPARVVALGGTGMVTENMMKELNVNKFDFSYKTNFVFDGDGIPTSKDIGLVAVDKNGTDCTKTYMLDRHESDENSGKIVFSVAMDGKIYMGIAKYTKK